MVGTLFQQRGGRSSSNGGHLPGLRILPGALFEQRQNEATLSVASPSPALDVLRPRILVARGAQFRASN
jgi:hypothetical protein